MFHKSPTPEGENINIKLKIKFNKNTILNFDIFYISKQNMFYLKVRGL